MKTPRFFQKFIRSSSLILGLLLMPLSASAQTPTTGEEALALALADSRLTVTDTMRIEGIDAVLHRLNPNPKWEFMFRDGDQKTIITVQAGKDNTIYESTATALAQPEFFLSLPAISDVEMPEIYLEKAKEVWIAEDGRIKLRSEYIIEYSLCYPKRDGAVCASSGDPKETWQVVLRADVEGGDGWIVRSIGFEDGDFAGIENVRIGGNW